MPKLPLHTKIVIGLIAGLVFGFVCIYSGIPNSFVTNYIKPVGTIFVNALKLIAMPLILASLIIGVTNLGDVSKLSRLGVRTISIYIITTVIAISVGLVLVNTFQPGKLISAETREELFNIYGSQVEETTVKAEQEVKSKGPLQPLVDIIPDNIFASASDNANMLQIVFFALIFGIALLQVPAEKGKSVKGFFEGLNEVVLKLIDYIMIMAPYGVFALMASLIVELAGDNPAKAMEILSALLSYAGVVLAGLATMILIVYPLILRIFTKFRYKSFYTGIRDAQLLGFSTSSSNATLPVTMECVEKNLGVPEKISSFVLPLGATINMDGTSLYQGVAAVFIAQALGLGLTFADQLMIVFTATLASIGSAGVPGAGMVMLVIVLESVGVPAAGLALIVAPDRILDMCRTVVNITGDSMVAAAMASSEGEQLDV